MPCSLAFDLKATLRIAKDRQHCYNFAFSLSLKSYSIKSATSGVMSLLRDDDGSKRENNHTQERK